MQVNDEDVEWTESAMRSHALSVLRAPATSPPAAFTEAPASTHWGAKDCASASILSALYWVHKQAYCGPLRMSGKGWFAQSEWAVELAPRPVTNALNPVPAKPLKLAYAHPTDSDWIGVPRFWGLQTLGTPREDRRCLGQALAPAATLLARPLRDIQTQALQAILRSQRSHGGAFVQADCGACAYSLSPRSMRVLP